MNKECKESFLRGVLSACWELYGYHDDIYKSSTVSILRSHGVDPVEDLDLIKDVFHDDWQRIVALLMDNKALRIEKF